MSEVETEAARHAATIALRDMTFTYAIATSPALRDVSIEVPAGQICGIVGRAGAGKSTLCALCAGFIPSFYQGKLSGSAWVDGQNVIEQPVSELVRHVGLVGSNPFSQISGARFSVYEEIGFGLENLGLPREEIVERIEWALAVMQLVELRDRSPYALSGGQQQRLVLAATLVMRPPVLILDEPTAQLDPPATEQLAALLRELSRQGTTILFAEHRLEWAAELAERVVVLDEGQVIVDGPPSSALADPLLLERAVGWPRPAQLAARARSSGLWPADRALPATFDALVAGLRQEQEPRTESREPPRGETPAGSTENHPEGRRPQGQPRTEERGPAGSTKNKEQRTTDYGLQHQSPIIQIEDIRFSYPSGVEALRGVSLAIGAGERIALLGRNGAGKSTLLRHMNGLFQPSSGRALVAGHDTRKTTVAQCARHVGIVFQDIRNQLFARTVREELRFGPGNLGYAPARIDALVERALQALGLTSVADLHPYDLPPALRRLVAIAAVVAMDNAVLVLDEPTAGLDTPSVARLVTLARDLAKEGKSLVVVSHDLDFCFEALDRVILLQQGQIVLESAWGQLDTTARALLAADVGLPLALRTAEALMLPENSDLALLLAARDGAPIEER